MAIKKEALDNFFEEDLPPTKKRTYSSYRVFDEIDKNNSKSGDTLNKTEEKSRPSYNTTSNKDITEAVTIGKQLVNNWSSQTGTNGNPLVNKGITERPTIHENNKPRSCSKNSVSSLSGFSRKIVFAIYQSCKISGSDTTDPITLDHLASLVDCNKKCIKTIINRLKKKDLLDTIEYKTGRGGWVIYRLSQSLYLDILKNEGLLSLSTGINKRETQPITQGVTSHFSSSSSKDLYKTTTTDQTIPSKPEGSQLPDEWLAIDIEPLRSINFTHMHLSQLATEEQLTPKIVQQSIDFFAFDLSNNNKAKTIKGSPLNFFMGILRNRGGYAIPGNYGSPEERYMKDYAEKIRQQGEEMARLENEAIELSFKSWYVILPDQEKIKLIPGTNISKLKDDPYKFTGKRVQRLAREYFKDVVWPNIRERVMAGEVLVDEYKEIDTDKQVYGILDLLREESAIKARINPAP